MRTVTERQIPRACAVLLLAASTLLLLPSVRAEGLSEIEIHVLGIKSNKGEIAFQLFDSKERYETRSEPLRSGFRSIEDKACSWTIANLPPGEYVLQLYHDRNGNRELDRRAFGIPKEPYGFSNNARANFGPPSYDAIRFDLDGGRKVLEIALN